MVIPSVILFAISILISRKGHSNFAGFLLIATVSFVILYFGSVLGYKSGAQYMYFAMLALPMAFFDKRNYIYLGLGSALPIFCFFLLIWVLFGVVTPIVMAPFYFKLLQLTIAGTSFVIIFGSHYIFFKMVNNSEEKLIENIEVLNHSNGALTTALTNLKTSNTLVQSLGQQAALGAILRGIMHEVKGPLTSIRAGCNLILMEETLSEDTKENIESMQVSIYNLSELIKTLLADAGSVVWIDAPLTLDQMIDQILKLVDNEGFSRKIKLEKSVPPQLPVVKGTSAYVSQALLNLLLNALRFSPEKSKIKVTVKVENPWVKIYVTDSGPGIDPAIKDNLFEQGVTTASPGEGSHVGLGLHFVKRVMDAHKGSISVFESSPRGTTFVMALPIWKE